MTTPKRLYPSQARRCLLCGAMSIRKNKVLCVRCAQPLSRLPSEPLLRRRCTERTPA
jgi:hypothetical protein